MRPSSRASRWWSSWRISLRLARRDVRRHRGRSLLAVTMVAAPAALMVGALTWFATSNIDDAERIPGVMGSAQALISAPALNVVYQDGAALGQSGDDVPAAPIPGFEPDGSAASKAAAIGALTRGRAVAVSEIDVRVVLGERSLRAGMLSTDARAGLGDKARLVSGRWPVNDSEVVVTPYGRSRGLPMSGAITISAGGRHHVVAIVGQAVAMTQWNGPPMLVGPGTWGLEGRATTNGWLIVRDAPVTWPEVRKLNRYGLVVVSAQVLRHPPSSAELPDQIRGASVADQQRNRLLVVAGGAMLMIVTTLLVGPAFAVSASRQRHTLAIAASNGAETRQLRRSVLAQALVLGVVAALLGCLLGLGVARLARAWLLRDPGYTTGPFDAPWDAVIAVACCACVSSLVAAMMPARRLGRLDVVGVLRGRSGSARVSRGLPFLGLLVGGAGGLGLLWSVARMRSELYVVAATVAFVLGVLMLVPLLLVAVSRLASSLPMSVRMASRDAARQRGRSGPAVGAVVGAVAALTVLSVGLTSDTEQRRREYHPTQLTGEASVSLNTQEDPSLADEVARTLASTAPRLETTPLRVVRSAWAEPSVQSGAVPFVNVLPPGCTPERTINDAAPVSDTADAAAPGRATSSGAGKELGPQCQRVGTHGANTPNMLAVLPADEIARRLRLSAAQRTVVQRGGMVVMGDGLAARDGTVVVVGGRAVIDPQTGSARSAEVEDRAILPAVVVPLTLQNTAAMGSNVAALATPAVAQAHHWPLVTQGFLLRDPIGSIDQATERRIDEALGGTAPFVVERGFERPDGQVMAVLLAIFAFLLLVVTLSSTALSLAEQQSDQATLAAVGATRGTRRRMAAGQSLLVCGLGALLGLLVGLVPGIAITYPLTAQSFSPLTGLATTGDPIIAIPWLPLAVVVVGVPIVAAALSAVAVRRAPVVTRRLG